MAKANKKQVMLLIFLIIATLVALFLMNKDKIKIFQNNNANTTLNNDELSQIKANESRIDMVLQENKKLLQSDEKFLDSLDSYINLPMTEEEYNNFIGTVRNDYPFGNPISDKK